MKEQLLAYIQKKQIGVVEWDRVKDRLTFSYDDEWRNQESAYPLSLSMPLPISVHPHNKIEPFLWGLLPDNDTILGEWGKNFHVSPRHAFSLLTHTGEECAGAVQFVRPERAEIWLNLTGTGNIKWLTHEEISQRIELLVQNHGASRLGNDEGHFSLAGAQAKTALRFDENTQKWGVPVGNEPTTHILKPATGKFDGFAENEHFCLRLAANLDLSVAKSYVEYFGAHPVFVVKRYDRVEDKRSGEIIRVHQEDFCQALAIPPHLKYQNQGGPSPADVVAILRDYSSKPSVDIWRFIDALVLNWIIAGTDGHAKNYSLMIAQNQKVRLAPFYDIISSLPYPKIVNPRKAKLAMKIGGEYRLNHIGKLKWGQLAGELKVKPADLLDRIESLARKIPTAIQKTTEELFESKLEHPVIKILSEEIEKSSGNALKLPQ